ncbi:adenosylmethionine decarboxylase [Dendrosporobacter sp. 1207_IL3150]|uniref:adenosylmethionine decarboxylase n=1 Tax=Dendrosporobacter sp. 1207_IL3150 TaxID=3084054 RepID=UPI002FDAE94C
MKLVGRHLTVDMYGCSFEALDNLDSIKHAIFAGIQEANLNLLEFSSHKFEPHGVTALALLNRSHMNVHTYPDLGYAAIDIFTCETNASPEKAVQALKSYLKPEKVKTTHVKRGDFGSVKDMKPKTKVTVAPIRRIKNTSAKVIKMLSRSK